MAKVKADPAADLKLVQDVFVKDKAVVRLDDSNHTLLDPPKKSNTK